MVQQQPTSFWSKFAKNYKTKKVFPFLRQGYVRQAGRQADRGQALEWYFLKWAIPGLFFFIFVFSINSWQKQVFNIWLDSNRGQLVSDATALLTEPQPLPQNDFFNRLPNCHFYGLPLRMEQIFLVRYSIVKQNVYPTKCDQIGRFFGLWATFCPNLPHS